MSLARLAVDARYLRFIEEVGNEDAAIELILISLPKVLNSKKPKFDFESVYKGYPLKVGKTKGLKICEREIRTQEDFTALGQAIARYSVWLSTDQNGFKPSPKHFCTFMAAWRDWVDPDAGKIEMKAIPRPVSVPDSDVTQKSLEDRERQYEAEPKADPARVKKLIRSITGRFS